MLPPGRTTARLEVTAPDDYFGTLKMAMRFFPILNVCRSVAENTRLVPFVVASRQPAPLVIFAPFGALTPLIIISPAMVRLLSLVVTALRSAATALLTSNL